MQRVYLKKGREGPVLKGHPWIFSGAIERTEGDTENTPVTDIYDWQRNWIARGLYSPKSQIRIRVLTGQDEAIDRDFFTRRFSQALSLRKKFLFGTTNAYRLVNGEGDFLPGLIVDRYADFLVCQFFTSGMNAIKRMVVDSLTSVVAVKGVFERSEGRVRQEEELEPEVGVLAGEAPPELIVIEENGFKFLVDVRRGQKTGFFLDQRDNRSYLAALTRGQTVLNCFAYTGGFSVYALGSGAKEVTSLDSSKSALELARQNLALNHLPASDDQLVKADAFAYLKECRSSYDMIVLDPPSLARRRRDVEAATGGYKFLNLHALRLVKAGGLLLTFSCSQHLSLDLFQKVIFGAAVDARRKVSTLKRLGHSIDHPVSLHHPEGEYLKGFVLKVLD